jgi:propionyl-CoA carboxylase beta chain
MSAEPAASPEPTGEDRRTTAGKAEILKARRANAADRRKEAIDKQHAKGKMTALERIEAFSRSTVSPGIAPTISG